MRRLRSMPLLARFGLLSVLGMALLALVLTHAVGAQVEQRALRNAEDKAATIAAVVFESALAGADLSSLSPAKLDALDDEVRRTRDAGTGLVRVKVFDGRTLDLVFSDERERIGEPGGPIVRRALTGEIHSKVVHGTGHTGRGARMLEVYIPIQDGGGVPSGVFEVYLDHAPVDRAISADTRRLQGMAVGGLAVLWLLLFRVVASASARLRRHADESGRLARTDALTGLPNRHGFLERVEARLQAPGSGAGALLLVDLADFRDLNDTLGHEHGDHVLRTVAERMRAGLGDDAVCARLDGDEFAAFVPDVADPEALGQIVRAAVGEPIAVAGMAVRVDAVIGVALHPAHGDSASTLLRHADVAQHAAEADHGRVQVFRADLDRTSRRRLELGAALPDAIGSGQVVPFYQPIVRATDGEVVAVEALARWLHPEHGLLPPSDFIPIAERTGAMAALTASILDQALADARRWAQDGHTIGIACNLGAASATDPRLPGVVADALERHAVAPSLVTLELSEDTVMSHPERVIPVVAGLAALGVRLALDDFGTGSSSLAHLHRLPLHQLKIDRSFVRLMADAPEASLVAPILALAQGLGLDTVAEGVEDACTATALADAGCHELQGFHFARPMPAADLASWLGTPVAT